jgi:hypothetical protein
MRSHLAGNEERSTHEEETEKLRAKDIHRFGLRYVPHMVLGLWLLFLAITVWQHAARSEFPPIHDALTYFEKAKNFWSQVDQSGLFNPFDVEPAFRPPGTVAMSYPFGFSADYRPFYFRSVVLPILCLTLAVFFAGNSRELRGSAQCNLALVAIFLSTLPLFYYFEMAIGFPALSHWGLVDNFLGGTSALAAAACIRSLRDQSRGWLISAACIAAFGLLIKPSGALVMGLIAAVWVAGIMWRMVFVETEAAGKHAARRLLLRGLCVIGVIYGIVFLASFSSTYLSIQNLLFGTTAIAIMRAELQVTPGLLLGLVHMSYGAALPLGAALIAVLAATYWNRFEPHANRWGRHFVVVTSVAACGSLGFGIWFWLFGSGGTTHPRYMAPFAFMFAVFMAPLVMQVTDRLPRWGTAVFRAWCVLPTVNLGLLLVHPDPSADWQRWTGVNLSVGKSIAIIDQAKALVNQTKKDGASVYLYAAHGVEDAVFQAVTGYENAMNPAAPRFVIRRPVDWQRPTVYRLDGILESDYILFEPTRDPAVKGRVLAQKTVATHDEERALFHAWFTDLTEGDGVVLVSETPTARVLKIVDRARFGASLSSLESAHSWRPIFVEANPRRWWSERDLTVLAKQFRFQLTDIQFAESFKVRALSVKRNLDEVSLGLWWERAETQPGEWYFFIHSVNSAGRIIVNNQISLFNHGPVTSDDTIRFDQVTFRHPPGKDVSALGVGIYRPGEQIVILPADSGTRDWGGRRVIVPLP